jgi:hypothetical protein
MASMLQSASFASIILTGMNTAQVTSLASFCQSCTVPLIVGMNTLNTGNVLSMASMFQSRASTTNALDLSGLDVRKVTTMASMFQSATITSLTGFDTWNPLAVTTTASMFQSFITAGSLSFTGWNAPSLTTTANMFNDATMSTLQFGNVRMDAVTSITGMLTSISCGIVNMTGFRTTALTAIPAGFLVQGVVITQFIASNWNMLGVLSISNFFGSGSTALTIPQIDVSGWNMPQLTTAVQVFRSFTTTSTVDVSLWTMGKVTTINSLFNGNTFNILGAGNWDVSKVVDMTSVFVGPTLTTTSLDLSRWVTSSLINLPNIFSNTGMVLLNVTGWNTASVTGMNAAFSGTTAGSANVIGLQTWNVGGTFTLASMFQSSTGRISPLDLSTWRPVLCTNFNSMFQSSSYLSANGASVNLSGWTFGSGYTMANMFTSATISTLIGLNTWDVSGVTTMANMFQSAVFANGNPDLSNWRAPAVTTIASMFTGLTTGTLITLNNLNCTSALTSMTTFIGTSTKVTYNIAGWDVSNVASASGTLGTGMTQAHYDQYLLKFATGSTLSCPPSLVAACTPGSVGTTKYTIAVAGVARATLVSRGWVLVDGGGI